MRAWEDEEFVAALAALLERHNIDDETGESPEDLAAEVVLYLDHRASYAPGLESA